MKLKFKNNKFRIVQLTDIHIGSSPFDSKDIQTFNLIDNILDKLEADLVMITGDMVWNGIDNFEEVFEYLLRKLNRKDIYVAMTPGNHDNEENPGRSKTRQMFEDIIVNKVDKIHSTITEDRESYVIEIYNEDSIANVIYVFDSGEICPLGISKYDFIKPSQVEWFNKVSLNYKREKSIKKDLVFMHIPLPEYWQGASNIISGVCLETNDMISSPYINTGLFTSLLLNKNIYGVFCGHDHDNNFDSILYDTHLVFGNVTGYNCYGELPRGCRVIDLHKDNVKTYIKVDKDFE